MVLCRMIRVALRVTKPTVRSQCCSRAMYSTEHTNRFYTRKHEWVSVKDNIGTVGVSSYAQEIIIIMGVCNASGIANTLLSHKSTGTWVTNAGTQHKVIMAAYLRPKMVAIQTGLGPYHEAIVGYFVVFYDRPTSAAEDALGEVVYVQLPDVSKNLKAGEECGALESVKAASELFSPVSGTVTEKNDKVESAPSLINKSCYSDGWLFRLKLTRPEELDKLMDQVAYDKYLKESH